jgi:hypothetical protein
MKRKDINPLLKLYDTITYNVSNITEANRVSVFRAIGVSEVQKGKKIFEFDYLPLLDIKYYNVLLDEYENNNTLIELYKHCSYLYFHLFMEAVQWYDENNKVTGAFDFKKQLEEYESKISNDFSCPIIRYLDSSKLGNINFYKNLRNVISYSESKGISLVNELLYGTIEPNIQSKRNEMGELLINSVINITYNRFKIFLKTIPPQQNETEQDNNEVSQTKTNKLKTETEQNNTDESQTKTNKLKTKLSEYGFFELAKVKKLSDPNKIKLVELISTNGLPYSIAMFDFLEFLKHMRDNHFKTHNQLNIEVATWFFASKDGRSVKGNISVLINNSTENRGKYTSHIHKEQVQKDFNNLK